MSTRQAIFITGAASGIGLAAAKRFAREGWFVGLADINAAGLKAALDAVGRENGATYLLDVRDRGAWDDGLSVFVTAAGGRLDALLNNAGVATFKPLEEMSEDEVMRQLDINLKGVIHGARAGLPYLKATPGSQLINVASCAALYGTPDTSIYSATKFAVRGFSQSLEFEFARHGVGVKCIMPWFVETAILDIPAQGRNETLSAVLREGGVPVYKVEDASDVIWNAAHAKALEYVVGARGKQFRWMAQLVPGVIRRQLASAARKGKVVGS
jgi:NAD(P)-dependent dehydrogenase (short-subunit alcohol dehydrogenase family)